ncbi:MAG TPA: RNA methyltransferase [Polyangiales bacterium]
MRRDAAGVFSLPPLGPLPVASALVIEALDALLTEERRARIERVIGARSRAVVPVLDGLIDPHNVAAVLRSADAFGVQEVHLVEGGERFVASNRVAQGTERWVDVIRHDSAHACVAALHDCGYGVYVAAMDGSLRPEDLAAQPRVAIVFGNEHAGVSDELRALADGTYTIPMRGFVQSLNVSVAAAITLAAATRDRPGDLDAEQRQTLRARYLLASIPRAHEILNEHLRRHGA